MLHSLNVLKSLFKHLLRFFVRIDFPHLFHGGYDTGHSRTREQFYSLHDRNGACSSARDNAVAGEGADHSDDAEGDHPLFCDVNALVKCTNLVLDLTFELSGFLLQFFASLFLLVEPILQLLERLDHLLLPDRKRLLGIRVLVELQVASLCLAKSDQVICVIDHPLLKLHGLVLHVFGELDFIESLGKALLITGEGIHVSTQVIAKLFNGFTDRLGQLK